MKTAEPYSEDVYYKIQRRNRLGLLLFAVIVIIIAVAMYPICDNDKVTYLDGFKVIFYHLGYGGEPTFLADNIFWEMLLPRAIAGVCVGGLLGIVGTVMQQMLANPLADPYTTGISSGAGLGAVLFIVFGFSIIPGLTGNNAMVVNAFILSMIPMLVIVLINRFRKTSTSEIILIGLGLMFFFGAANSFVILMGNPNNLQDAYSWGLGNLGTIGWDNIAIIFGASIGGMLLFTLLTEKVRVLVNPDAISQALGENPYRLRTAILMMVSFLIACVVSFTGTIGFVGIVAPHIVRLFLGSDLKLLLPASFFSGALILTLADVAGRMVGLPVGVMTSVFGGAIFIVILIKQRKKEML